MPEGGRRELGFYPPAPEGFWVASQVLLWRDAQVGRAGSGSISLGEQILAGEADPLQVSEGEWVGYQLPAV